jgi:hypothetical protein
MGVTPENARLAMRVLISQFINGASTDLAPNLFNFQLFQTDYSKHYMQLLMERLQKG